MISPFLIRDLFNESSFCILCKYDYSEFDTNLLKSKGNNINKYIFYDLFFNDFYSD